jgi:hypothetical protein
MEGNLSKQYVIIQDELAIAVKRYTETEDGVTILPGDIEKILSAPRGVYLQPKQIKIVGCYAIVEQREKSYRSDTD